MNGLVELDRTPKLTSKTFKRRLEEKRAFLERKRAFLESQLKEVDAALDALDKNPAIAQVVEAIVSVNTHY